MKKLILVFVLFLLSIFLVSCGESDEARAAREIRDALRDDGYNLSDLLNPASTPSPTSSPTIAPTPETNEDMELANRLIGAWELTAAIDAAPSITHILIKDFETGFYLDNFGLVRLGTYHATNIIHDGSFLISATSGLSNGFSIVDVSEHGFALTDGNGRLEFSRIASDVKYDDNDFVGTWAATYLHKTTISTVTTLHILEVKEDDFSVIMRNNQAAIKINKTDNFCLIGDYFIAYNDNSGAKAAWALEINSNTKVAIDAIIRNNNNEYTVLLENYSLLLPDYLHGVWSLESTNNMGALLPDSLRLNSDSSASWHNGLVTNNYKWLVSENRIALFNDSVIFEFDVICDELDENSLILKLTSWPGTEYLYSKD
ncbi:MAG: hypothetical protein FWD44_07400 [Oscillospiraceae bacterium]|nr:hypothetical protein [Oscillospiraceae bacterium]